MAYVITRLCRDCVDGACVEICPKDCILEHRPANGPSGLPRQLFIDPVECIDCGACVPVCPVSAIFALDDLPEKWHSYIEKNANYVTGGKFQANTYKAA